MLAVGVVLGLLLSACGGSPQAAPKPAKPGAAATGSAAPGEPSPSASASPEPAPDPAFGAPRVGTCHRMTAVQSVASVARGRRVACTKRHTSVVAHVAFLPLPVSAATPVPRRRVLGQRWCAPAYRKLAGGTPADRATALLTWTMFTPSQAQLERGARWIRCDVVARSGARLMPLPATTPFLGSGVPETLRVCRNDAGTDVSCDEPHAFRVQAVYKAVGKAYPDPEAYTPTARARCRQLMGSYGGFWQPPSQAGWRAGDRFVRCLTPATAESP